MRACFVLAHQAAKTGHIRMQNGGELPVLTTNFQDLSHSQFVDLARDEEHYIGYGIG